MDMKQLHYFLKVVEHLNFSRAAEALYISQPALSYQIAELEREFPKEVTDALRLLTHEEGTDYFDYVRSVRRNPVARKVKLADLAHNSDETRFAGCGDMPEKQLFKLQEKYAKARAILEGSGDE